jgi:cytochrome c-type biogenesis protein CcmH/NrfG
MAGTDQLLLSQILDQLGWIRIHLQVLIVIGIAFVATLIAVGRTMSKQIRADFPRRGQELLNREKYKEVVERGTKHLRDFPGDAHSQWLVAQAHMRLGNLNEALIHGRKTQALQPDWENVYTGAFIAYAEQQLAKSKTKAELRVVPPNPSPQSDAPSSGGAPLS